MSSGLKCYFPNGALSPSVPCDPSAEVTHCCLKKEQCLTNGICAIDATINYGIQYGRGVCSDSTWQSPVCPKVCLDNQDLATNSSAHDFRANGAGIYECNAKGYGQEAEYCCESASEKARCCSTTSVIFTMPAASLGAVAIRASSTPVTTSVFTTTSIPASSTIGPSSTSGPTASATAAPISTPTEAPTKKISTGGAVGAGVGGALGVCLLVAALVFLFLRRRKQHKYVEHEDVEPTPVEKYELKGVERHTPELEGSVYRHELEASGSDVKGSRHELAAPPPARELPNNEVIAELPGKKQ
ncbi:hypothetical protein CC86DRAFT_406312 [Ophiobolus disseminans]|uniref:Mid2 domain-containing protein n=1 Tax=Ophiobolus disseminans TaxID=1469910 RepID=A0A6A7A2Q2_9PLEO|nr:hypothetical protein CC86DRAFT_406312 [Ophiobolus disseminans]